MAEFMLYEDGMGMRHPQKERHPSMYAYVTSGEGESIMKLALVTIVTANLEPMRTF